MTPDVLDQIRERNTYDRLRANIYGLSNEPWNQAKEDRALLLRYVDELRAEKFGIGAIEERTRR